ncbi:MAG: M23 family peptidase, partial [Microcoleus sp. SIO2G3]|nr:M23 family peptidase [Microcoleus sp. SIO2G3]
MPLMPTSSPSRSRRSWFANAGLWVRRQRTNGLRISLTLGVIIAIVAVAVPVRAVQVSLSPTNPQLGDTLSVVVQQSPTLNSTPTVKMGGKTYPTHITNSGNFRALLPTTPLDQPGTLQIQVEGGGEVKKLSV